MGKGGGGSGRKGGREQGSNTVVTEQVRENTSLQAVENSKELTTNLRSQWLQEVSEINKAIRGEDSKYSNVDKEKLLDYKDALVNVVSGSNRIGIKDKNGNIQALISYTKKQQSISVDFLVTAPWNLNNGSRSVKGGGTTAMLEAVKTSFREGKEGRVTLISLPTAKKFYEKLGFTTKDGEEYSLSSENARKLLKKFE